MGAMFRTHAGLGNSVNRCPGSSWARRSRWNHSALATLSRDQRPGSVASIHNFSTGVATVGPGALNDLLAQGQSPVHRTCRKL